MLPDIKLVSLASFPAKEGTGFHTILAYDFQEKDKEKWTKYWNSMGGTFSKVVEKLKKSKKDPISNPEAYAAALEKFVTGKRPREDGKKDKKKKKGALFMLHTAEKLTDVLEQALNHEMEDAKRYMDLSFSQEVEPTVQEDLKDASDLQSDTVKILDDLLEELRVEPVAASVKTLAELSVSENQASRKTMASLMKYHPKVGDVVLSNSFGIVVGRKGFFNKKAEVLYPDSTVQEHEDHELNIICSFKQFPSIYGYSGVHHTVGNLAKAFADSLRFVLVEGKTWEEVRPVVSSFYKLGNSVDLVGELLASEIEKVATTASFEVTSKIVKVKDKWQVQSEKGKNLGTYDTKEEAEKRLKEVEMFKHVKKKGSSSEEIKTYFYRELAASMERKSMDTSKIGSGELPNKYYVTAMPNFYVSPEGKSSYGYASEIPEFKEFVNGKEEEFGPFDTFPEAFGRFTALFEEIPEEPTMGACHSVMIEDHVSGEIYSGSLYAAKHKWGWKFGTNQNDDTKFTSDTLGYDIKGGPKVEEAAIKEEKQAAAEREEKDLKVGVDVALDELKGDVDQMISSSGRIDSGPFIDGVTQAVLDANNLKKALNRYLSSIGETRRAADKRLARNFDGTGPEGKGPGTGRGMGPCLKNPRQAFYLTETNEIVIIKENEPGYFLTDGSYEKGISDDRSKLEAKVKELNSAQGLSDEEVNDIILSSMKAQHKQPKKAGISNTGLSAEELQKVLNLTPADMDLGTRPGIGASEEEGEAWYEKKRKIGALASGAIVVMNYYDRYWMIGSNIDKYTKFIFGLSTDQKMELLNLVQDFMNKAVDIEEQEKATLYPIVNKVKSIMGK